MGSLGSQLWEEDGVMEEQDVTEGVLHVHSYRE